MASAIFVVTIVLIRAPSSGIPESSLIWLNSYSPKRQPDILPVRVIYSPDFVSLTYTPRRSASGSVASTKSASFSLASFNASSNASSASGFG